MMKFPGWIRRHLFLTFLIFSLLAHFIALGAVRVFHRGRGISGPRIIECEYYPLRPPPAHAPPPEEKAAANKPPLRDKLQLFPEEMPSLPKEAMPPVPAAEEEEIDYRAALENLIPASTPVRKETLPDYVNSLRGRINARINYPDLAFRMGLEGSVVVSFSLNRRGRLLSLTIPREGRSTFAPFNEEAVRAVRRASRNFPRFPDSVKGEVVRFTLPVSFEIKNEKDPAGFPLP